VTRDEVARLRHRHSSTQLTSKMLSPSQRYSCRDVRRWDGNGPSLGHGSGEAVMRWRMVLILLVALFVGCTAHCSHAQTNWRYNPEVDPLDRIFTNYCVICGETIKTTDWSHYHRETDPKF
jgi:hypothetical protein